MRQRIRFLLSFPKSDPFNSVIVVLFVWIEDESSFSHVGKSSTG